MTDEQVIKEFEEFIERSAQEDILDKVLSLLKRYRAEIKSKDLFIWETHKEYIEQLKTLNPMEENK